MLGQELPGFLPRFTQADATARFACLYAVPPPFRALVTEEVRAEVEHIEAEAVFARVYAFQASELFPALP